MFNSVIKGSLLLSAAVVLGACGASAEVEYTDGVDHGHGGGNDYTYYDTRISSIVIENNLGNVIDQRYFYYDDGLLSRIDADAKTTYYGYDSVDRLISKISESSDGSQRQTEEHEYQNGFEVWKNSSYELNGDLIRVKNMNITYDRDGDVYDSRTVRTQYINNQGQADFQQTEGLEAVYYRRYGLIDYVEVYYDVARSDLKESIVFTYDANDRVTKRETHQTDGTLIIDTHEYSYDGLRVTTYSKVLSVNEFNDGSYDTMTVVNYELGVDCHTLYENMGSDKIFSGSNNLFPCK